eukprot:CAMPEP_0185018596 /NCGR_PEP_ID=MMETSP1103-20130426/1261_1 /TAXON_ID=36769 /ORGANISM="Paraphysomonas bandaiensis, Strain Caron Lab Isolate" /LENGTH=394 /DNA_ID=CAMNT_0027548451 /DNA_START=269 /DNA_END=1453 /DNA_ORIENTATION=+
MQSYLQNARGKNVSDDKSKKPWSRLLGEVSPPSQNRRKKREAAWNDNDDDDIGLSDSDSSDYEMRHDVSLLADIDHESLYADSPNKEDFAAVDDVDDGLDVSYLKGVAEDISERQAEYIVKTGDKTEDEDEYNQDAVDDAPKSRKKAKDDENEDKFSTKLFDVEISSNPSAGVPPEVKSMISNMEPFEDMARKGKEIDNSTLDGLDSFLAHMLVEANKTKDGTVMFTEELGNQRKRIRTPRPRTTRQLARAVTPQIKSVKPNTDGYKLGSEAWEVLSKNPYYTQEEKEEMCNYIAQETDYILHAIGFPDAEIQENEEHAIRKKRPDPEVWMSQEEVDKEMVFDVDFRPGIEGVEADALAEQKRKEQVLTKSEPVDQGVTDWSVEAVQDEDDLFK